jgi:hypothetical protein
MPHDRDEHPEQRRSSVRKADEGGGHDRVVTSEEPLTRAGAAGGLGSVLSRSDTASARRLLGSLQRQVGNRQAARAVAPIQRVSDDELIGPVPRQPALPAVAPGSVGPVEKPAPPHAAMPPVPVTAPPIPKPAPAPKSGPSSREPSSGGPATATTAPDEAAEAAPVELDAAWLAPEADADLPVSAGPSAAPAAPPPRRAPAPAEAQAVGLDAEQTDRDSVVALDAMLAGIDAAVTAGKARIGEEATQREARLDAVHDDQAAQLRAQVASAVAAVRAGHRQERQAIGATTARLRRRLTDAAAAERNGATSHVQGLQVAVRAAGTQQATRARVESTRRATEVRAAGRQAQTGSGDAAVVDARRTANTKIADKAAKECLDTGQQLAAGVQAEAAQHATAAYGDLRARFDAQISDVARNGDQALDRFGATALGQADEIAHGAIAVITRLGTESAAALDHRRQAGRQQIRRWKQQAEASLAATAPRLRAPLERQRAAASAALHTFVEDAAGHLAASTDPAVTSAAASSVRDAIGQARAELVDRPQSVGSTAAAQVAGSLDEAVAGLDALTDQLAGDLTGAGNDLAAKIGAASSDATGGLAAVTRRFGDQGTAAVDGAVAELARGGETFRAETGASHEQVVAKLAQLVDDGLASEDRLVADAHKEMGATGAKISTRYEELRTEAERKNREGERAPVQGGWWSSFKQAVGGLIDSVRNWFTRTFGEFWGGLLFGVLAALVIVAVGICAAYVVGWLVGLVIVSAKAAAIVTAVILIVGAVGLGIYNRFQEFEADNPGKSPSFWQGLGLVGLGIADLTGIPYIVEGLVGQRAFGKELSESEKGERIGMGVVFLATAGLAAYKGVPALLRGKPKAPGGEPGAGAPGERMPDPAPAAGERAPAAPAQDQGPPGQPPRPVEPPRYDATTRTTEQLRQDVDPAPRAGETAAQAAARVQAAEAELRVREMMEVYDALGEEPPRLRVREHDAAHAAQGAHSAERHGPDVPLRRGDAPAGGRTVEGRIYGDPPWGNPQNWSYRWINDSVWQRTVQDYLTGSWERIRSDLAANGQHNATFDAGNLVGEGFYNSGMHGAGPQVAVYHRTSFVSITVRLVPGSSPPRFYIHTAFPAGRGQ